MNLRFEEEADAELIDAGQYYTERSPEVGVNFASAVEDALEHIRQMPWSAPAWPGRPDVRRRVLGKFPYTIVYMVVEPTEIVVIAWNTPSDALGTGLAGSDDTTLRV